jgi:predicted metal-dependent hydrolase
MEETRFERRNNDKLSQTSFTKAHEYGVEQWNSSQRPEILTK